MFLIKQADGRTGVRGRKQRGQSLVEFAISSIVLLLLAMGLLDLSRAFYYAVSLQGAAREGARHGAWYDQIARRNPYLDDSDIMLAVNQSLAGAGLTGVQVVNPGCLVGAGNTVGNKPYPASAYPSAPNAVNVYICYTTNPGGATQSSLMFPGTCPGCGPPDNSWRLGDVNVALLMNFQLITPFIQSIFGNGIDLAFNEHFTIQGKP